MVHYGFCGLSWCVDICYRCREHAQHLISDVSDHQFLQIFCMKGSRIIVQYALPWGKLSFSGARISISLTCLQTQDIYPLIRQSSTCIHLYCHTTDFDTIITSYLILSIITVLDFTVCSLQNSCELCFWIFPKKESHLQLGEVTDIIKLFSNHVCYNTQTMPIFQVWTSFWNKGFEMATRSFGKFVDLICRVYT